MIFRNSIKSILRTTVKTILFSLLIIAVTAFLYLGVNTWTASTTMLRNWDENCTTIVTMEYLDDYGSNKGSKSEAMLADVASMDFDAIAANENVLLWQPSDIGMGMVSGFASNVPYAEFSNPCVFIVTGLRQFAEDSAYYGELVESLYSSRPYEPGRGVFIQNRPGDFDFTPDPNATYVIHADNNRTNANGLSVQLSSFYSWIAMEAGIDYTAIEPILEIESAEALHADENNIYKTIAEYYAAMKNSITVRRARELGDLEEFNQSYLQPVSGRLFTREEADEAAKVCVISETLAKNRDLKPGDSLTINLPDDESSTMYTWGDKMSREETYTIVGIVNYHEDYHLNVYTPLASDSSRPIRYFYDLGQAAIKNGTVDSFLSQIEPLLFERVFITVYDQGYQTTADALKVIQNAGLALSVIALAVTLVVLAFFAYLFTSMQRDTIEIMRSFGTKKTEVRLYLMIGASIIAIIAITIGILIGVGYAEGLVKSAYTLISELQAVDMRYSDGFRGITKEFTPVVTLSHKLAATVGIGVLLIVLVLCLYFAEKTISGSLITTRSKGRIRRSPKKSSAALSGSLRHAMLSIRRGGARSLLVPVLSAVVLLFVSFLQATLVSYETAREDLYENTELLGYSAQMNGKFSDNLVIPNTLAKKFVELDHLSDAAYIYKFNYMYLGIPIHADGSAGEVKPEPWPASSFEVENLYQTLSAGPNVIFTDDVESAPEFYFGELHSDFMSGWDKACFSSREWEVLPCIVSSQFMSKHSIEPGDTIRVYMSAFIAGYPHFFSMDMQVVGSFISMAKQDNIYCPMPLGALDPQSSTINDLLTDDSTVKTGEYMNHLYNLETMPTAQQMLDALLDIKYVSAVTFKLSDPRVLVEVKDTLEEIGFSSPKINNHIRLCIVIEDSQFNETLSSIAQRSKYLEILYPVLLVLVSILGLVTGFLSINSRREDIALMRGMGTQKWRIFNTIFGEQLLLLIFGALPAVIALYVRDGETHISNLGVYAFFICYAFSAAIAALLQNTKSALSILSEKE